MYKPSKAEVQTAYGKTIPDVIQPHLQVLFCGINPGLYTAAVGHHFGRPGNRFWKSLFNGGFTPTEFHPSEQRELLKLGYGITNLVSRATATAAELNIDELLAGGKVLEEKVKQFQPKWLAVVGVDAYRKAFSRPLAKVGKQLETIEETRIWVLPNPSGLNAHYNLPVLKTVFAEFYIAVNS